MRVHQQLGDRVGRDILMLSISIDPVVDTPEAWRQYAARYGGNQPGWLFLTGAADDITLLRRTLGVYDPDPVIDADKTQHTGLITFGNDRTGRWAALPALMPSEELARTILRITREQNPDFPSRPPR
jgi:protein SCO1/2